MNNILYRRVDRLTRYMDANGLIPGRNKTAFIQRIELAENFESLPREDQYAILQAELESTDLEVIEVPKHQKRSNGRPNPKDKNGR